MRQSQAVGVVGGVAARRKRPEFAWRHRLVRAVAGVDELPLDVVLEFGSVAHQDVIQHHTTVLNAPHYLADRHAIKHAPVHRFQHRVKVEPLQLRGNKFGGLDVGGVVRVVRQDLPLQLGQCRLPLRPGTGHGGVGQEVAVAVEVAAEALREQGVELFDFGEVAFYRDFLRRGSWAGEGFGVGCDHR